MTPRQYLEVTWFRGVPLSKILITSPAVLLIDMVSAFRMLSLILHFLHYLLIELTVLPNCLQPSAISAVISQFVRLFCEGDVITDGYSHLSDEKNEEYRRYNTALWDA